jgi:hypothetical protein
MHMMRKNMFNSIFVANSAYTIVEAPQSQGEVMIWAQLSLPTDYVVRDNI